MHRSLLQIEEVHTFIGPFHILQGISLEVAEGTATVVLGRNGAGKTTMLRSIMGLYPPRMGRILLQSTPINGMRPHEIASKGVAYVPEDRWIFTGLTVEENLRLAWRGRSKFGEKLEFIFSIFPGLRHLLKRDGGKLSGGEQQMLNIARALINENVLLLIDEPSKGLAPILIEQLKSALNKLKGQVTFLLVEQNIALASALADRCYVLDNGRIVYQGSVGELIHDKELGQKLLGVGV